MSLRNQLLQAGLITEEQARESEQKRRQEGRSKDGRARERERQQRLEQRDTEHANQRAQSQARSRKLNSQTKGAGADTLEQIYSQGVLSSWAGRRNYFYLRGTTIDRLALSEETVRLLEHGQAAVVKGLTAAGQVVLLHAQAVRKLQRIAPERILTWHDGAGRQNIGKQPDVGKPDHPRKRQSVEKQSVEKQGLGKGPRTAKQDAAQAKKQELEQQEPVLRESGVPQPEAVLVEPVPQATEIDPPHDASDARTESGGSDTEPADATPVDSEQSDSAAQEASASKDAPAAEEGHTSSANVAPLAEAQDEHPAADAAAPVEVVASQQQPALAAELAPPAEESPHSTNLVEEESPRSETLESS